MVFKQAHGDVSAEYSASNDDLCEIFFASCSRNKEHLFFAYVCTQTDGQHQTGYETWTSTWLKNIVNLDVKVNERRVPLTQKSKLNHESISSSTWKLGNLDVKKLAWTPLKGPNYPECYLYFLYFMYFCTLYFPNVSTKYKMIIESYPDVSVYSRMTFRIKIKKFWGSSYEYPFSLTLSIPISTYLLDQSILAHPRFLDFYVPTRPKYSSAPTISPFLRTNSTKVF